MITQITICDEPKINCLLDDIYLVCDLPFVMLIIWRSTLPGTTNVCVLVLCCGLPELCGYKSYIQFGLFVSFCCCSNSSIASFYVKVMELMFILGFMCMSL